MQHVWRHINLVDEDILQYWKGPKTITKKPLKGRIDETICFIKSDILKLWDQNVVIPDLLLL